MDCTISARRSSLRIFANLDGYWRGLASAPGVHIIIILLETIG